MDFSMKLFQKYNKILIKLYTDYYLKCWKERNQILYNPEEQRRRTIDWYNNERNMAVNSNYLQVKAYALHYELNLEQSKIEYIKNR